MIDREPGIFDPPRRAAWVAALACAALAAACTDDPTPADAAVDNAPSADVSDAGDVSDASDAADAVTLPRCEWPDGGPPASTVSAGLGVARSLCNFCHQDSAPGAGDFSGQTFPRPRTMAYGANLTPDRETGIGARTDEQVLRAIRQGVAADGARRLCEMTPFDQGQLDDQRLCAVLAYLRSLPPVHRQIPASTCAR